MVPDIKQGLHMCAHTCMHVTHTDAHTHASMHMYISISYTYMKNGGKFKRGEQTVFIGREQVVDWLCVGQSLIEEAVKSV